jgi:hypothetical protein
MTSNLPRLEDLDGLHIRFLAPAAGIAFGQRTAFHPFGVAAGRDALGPELARRVRGEVDHHAMAVEAAHASALVQLSVLVDSLELDAHAAPLKDCRGGGDPGRHAAAWPNWHQSWGANSPTNGHEVAGSADPITDLAASARNCAALPVNFSTSFGRLALRAGLVTLRQTFVRRSHGGNCPCPGGSMMSNGTSSALNFEQELDSIPTAQGGLSRLAIARLQSAGVPVLPLLRRVGLTPEVIADPAERLSVRSQVALLDEVAIALKDDRLGFTLARDFDLREIGLLYYVMACSQTLGDALKRIAR